MFDHLVIKQSFSSHFSNLKMAFSLVCNVLRYGARMTPRRLKFIMLTLLLSLVIVLVMFDLNKEESIVQPMKESLRNLKVSLYQNQKPHSLNYPVATNYDRKDWQDYEFMKYEESRTGNGEQGKPYLLENPEDIELNNKLVREEGFHVIVSDRISVNRSLPDTRPIECKARQYLKELPSTSVIVIFRNEWLSILLRTVHSVYNRTPRELLHEIILVDDFSTNSNLGQGLDDYVKQNFDGRVKILRLSERKGLIVTRMEGAKIATGQVLVFLDSHQEAVVNWLPPLLEPIAITPTIITTPIIDSFNKQTFEHYGSGGTRGLFNEFFWYTWNQLLPKDLAEPSKPRQLPVMLGCAFAIRRDFFWDLGGYDPGLEIWNGEQIELSLKAHLCGSGMLEVPCSHISHAFRNTGKNHDGTKTHNYVARNFKRVAEVWLDEYKEVFYNTYPGKYDFDAGDLTVQKEYRQRLNCKPFQYFLENVAPYMYQRFFYKRWNPGYFASGSIQSSSDPEMCVDSSREKDHHKLTKCSGDEKNINFAQYFAFNMYKSINLYEKESCIGEKGILEYCKYNESDAQQQWKYDLSTQQLINQNVNCLTANLGEKNVFVSQCNTSDINQKWTWTNINATAIKNYDNMHIVNVTVDNAFL